MVKRILGVLASSFGMVLIASAAFAEGAQPGAAGSAGSYLWALALASGFGIGIAAFGGALAQGRAAVAALEGVARNPGAGGRIQTLMIIGLALIESLVIYALVITFLLQSKIPAIEELLKILGIAK
jgi:F-type H+-transporting ATPase subunit c